MWLKIELERVDDLDDEKTVYHFVNENSIKKIRAKPTYDLAFVGAAAMIPTKPWRTKDEISIEYTNGEIDEDVKIVDVIKDISSFKKSYIHKEIEDEASRIVESSKKNQKKKKGKPIVNQQKAKEIIEELKRKKNSWDGEGVYNKDNWEIEFITDVGNEDSFPPVKSWAIEIERDGKVMRLKKKKKKDD